ncbi:MAG: DnaJ domain-containing protein [Candidatus Bruticola sp.]
MRDHYLVLGVSPSANSDMIKSAYRKLSKTYHPDVYKGDPKEAQDMMSAITRAYEVLSNLEQRREYDNAGIFRMRVPKGFNNTAVDIESMVMRSSDLNKKNKKPGLWDKIKALFGHKPEVKHDSARARGILSVVMGMANQPELRDECCLQLQKAVEADPSIMEIQYDLAIMCYKLGRFDEAKQALNTCLKLKPDDKHTQRFLAILQ